MRRRSFAALAFAAFAPLAHAIDPAVAKGTLTVGGERIALTHAVAVQRDNAEGLLDRPRELRVAITDREVKPEALWGLAFLPVTSAAMRGEVRGVLLRWDPSKPDFYLLTILRQPEPGYSLGNTSVSNSEGVLPGVKIGNNRVSGKAQGGGTGPTPDAWQAEFSAPLFSEPAVTAELKGAAARSGPQVATLQTVQKGLAKGDWAAQRSLSTANANRQFDLMLKNAGNPDAKQLGQFAKQAAAEMAKTLPAVDRVVVRGQRAIVMMGKGGWRQMALDGDTWKIDE